MTRNSASNLRKINGHLEHLALEIESQTNEARRVYFLQRFITGEVRSAPRRSWKNGERSYYDNPELRKEFIYEMFDILLFHRAILAYAGITGDEFAAFAAMKMGYNQTRPDHNVNGTEAISVDPASELQGSCPSAKF